MSEMSHRRGPAAVAVAALLVLAAACAGGSASVSASPTAQSAPSLPGAPGHFDNGDFTFDYPASWRTLSGLYDETIVNEVDAVLGTGDWRTGCFETEYPDGHGSISCTGDTFVVTGGRVVVKVWRRVGGPVDTCGGDVGANATLGENAVLRTGSDSDSVWEIRNPGQHFGWANNVIVEAHTSSAAGLAQAEALVASLRWIPGRPLVECYLLDTAAPS
jgi:hypothetical protein